VSDRQAIPLPGPASVSTAHESRPLGRDETAQMRSLKLFAESLTERAVAYIQAGNYRQADQLLREAIEIYEKLYGPHHPNTLVLLDPAAKALQRAGRKEDAHALEARLRPAGPAAPRDTP
jgi:Tfp pilus assembly protein PilF